MIVRQSKMVRDALTRMGGPAAVREDAPLGLTQLAILILLLIAAGGECVPSRFWESCEERFESLRGFLSSLLLALSLLLPMLYKANRPA
jgi:hypothetical protein